MNQDERQIITQFVERIAGAAPAPAAPNGAATGGPWGGSSVPATQSRPNLPPVDKEGDALIADLFNKHPEARYRITQTAFVQEAALVEAQNRIRRLEWEVENAKREAQNQPQKSGGLFGGMFGGGAPQRRGAPMPPPPQPVYPPGYNPGMLQQQQGRGGSGFLGTALTTAAGVAGGMVLGNMLMNSLSGGHGAAHAATNPVSDTGAAGDAAGAGGFGQEAVPASSPWTDPGAAAASQGYGGADPGAAGGWDNQDATPASYDDAAAFDDGGGYDEEI